jgi:hypothetical protein
MREGIEYEFTLVGDLDLEHRLVISKSRCSEIADKVAQPHRAGELAETFKAWLGSGEHVDTLPAMQTAPEAPQRPVEPPNDAPPPEEEWVDHVASPPRLTPGQSALVKTFNGIADQDVRGAAKTEFIAKFGEPHLLTGADMAEAMKWVSQRVADWVKGQQEQPEQPELAS